MKKVKAVITFKLLDEDTGDQVHSSVLEYNNLSEERVLYIEKHLIYGFLGGLHSEAVEFIEAEAVK